MSDEQIEQLREMLYLGLVITWDNFKLGQVESRDDEPLPVATLHDDSGNYLGKYIALAGVDPAELRVYAPINVKWKPE